MRDNTLFPWRAPLAADWIARWQAADSVARTLKTGRVDDAVATGLCVAVRRLANERLGVSEQLKLESLARRLVPLADRLPGLRSFRIGLIGNRTLSFLINPLRASGLGRGLLIDAIEAPYDSAANFAFGDAGAFTNAGVDGVVVVLDEGAFAHGGRLLDTQGEDASLANAVSLLHRIAAVTRDSLGVPTIVATLPGTATAVSSADVAIAGTRTRFAARLNAEIVAGGGSRDWIVWDLAALAARVGHDAWFDPARFHQAKTPFAIEICPLVADHLSRIVAAMTGKSARALVLDLDNTLWGGVIGDDGVAGIELGQNSADGEAYVAFQRFVLGLRERGVVIAVCSKNTDEIAREPFRTHPEMVLRESHIAVFQANWEDKATNVQAIAEALNLGLESLVFVDDNPAERERVRQQLPLVSVPEIGSDPAWFPALLCDAGVFEHLILGADDLGRAESYEGNARRAELQSSAGNYDEYLQSLQMKLELSRFDELGRARIAQLINKSNQFNLTTRRYDEEDVRRLSADRDVICWQARLTDTFSAHGMIAVVIVRIEPGQWVIDTWLQSCRVLARGVEETLMNELVSLARAAGTERILGEYLPTARNGMVADFYPRLGFAELDTAPDGRKRFTCLTASFVPLKSFIDVHRSDGVLSLRT